MICFFAGGHLVHGRPCWHPFWINISRRCSWSRADIVGQKLCQNTWISFFIIAVCLHGGHIGGHFGRQKLTKMFMKSGRYCRKNIVSKYENLIFYQRQFFAWRPYWRPSWKQSWRGRSRDRAHVSPRKPRENLLPFRRSRRTHTHRDTRTYRHTQY